MQLHMGRSHAAHSADRNLIVHSFGGPARAQAPRLVAFASRRPATARSTAQPAEVRAPHAGESRAGLRGAGDSDRHIEPMARRYPLDTVVLASWIDFHLGRRRVRPNAWLCGMVAV